MFCLGCQAEEEEEGKGEEPEESEDKKGNQALHQEKVIFPPFCLFYMKRKSESNEGNGSICQEKRVFPPFCLFPEVEMKKETNLPYKEKVNPFLFYLFTQEK